MVVKVDCTPHICAFCRWKGGNGPEQTDSIATGNLIRATPKGIKRFVLVTSAGVERYNKLPFSILNLFGKLLTPMADNSWRVLALCLVVICRKVTVCKLM